MLALICYIFYRTHVPVAAVLVLNTPDDGRLRPKHVEWLCRNKTCTVLHQVGVSFDLYYDARKHKIKIYVVTSKCSRESLYFLDIQNCTIIKLLFLQNSPHVQLYTYASNCKGVGNIPESHLWKPLQLLRRILDHGSATTKVPSLQSWFQSREQVKISFNQVRRVWGKLQCCTLFCANK